jgi:hypothetical protein
MQWRVFEILANINQLYILGYVQCFTGKTKLFLRKMLMLYLFNYQKYLWKQTGCEKVGWIHTAQDRAQWQALVILLMNIHVP